MSSNSKHCVLLLLLLLLFTTYSQFIIIIVFTAEKNKLILAEKYKELKGKGQLDAFMKKKRKQNAKKDAGLISKGASRQKAK